MCDRSESPKKWAVLRSLFPTYSATSSRAAEIQGLQNHCTEPWPGGSGAWVLILCDCGQDS